MTSSGQTALLVMWVGFAVLALAGTIAVFVWAVRSRQFSDQDRVRSLPLMSGIPEGEEEGKKPGRKQAPEDEGRQTHVSD